MKNSFMLLVICMCMLLVILSVNAETQEYVLSKESKNLSVDDAKTIAEEFVKSKGISLDGYVISDVEKHCDYMHEDGSNWGITAYREMHAFVDNEPYVSYDVFNGSEYIPPRNYSEAMNYMVNCSSRVKWIIDWRKEIKRDGNLTMDYVGWYYPPIRVIINGGMGGFIEPPQIFTGGERVMYDLKTTPKEKLLEIMNITYPVESSNPPEPEPDYNLPIIIAIITAAVALTAIVIWYRRFR